MPSKSNYQNDFQKRPNRYKFHHAGSHLRTKNTFRVSRGPISRDRFERKCTFSLSVLLRISTKIAHLNSLNWHVIMNFGDKETLFLSVIYGHMPNCCFERLSNHSNVHFWSRFEVKLGQKCICKFISTRDTEILQILFWTKIHTSYFEISRKHE